MDKDLQSSGGSFGFMECGVCGNEHPGQGGPPPHPCPKCHAHRWRRACRPQVPPPAPLGRFRAPRDWHPLGAGAVVRSANRVYLPQPVKSPPPRPARRVVLS